REPLGQEPSMARALVLTDLGDRDRLLVEEALDRLRPRRHAGHVYARTLVAQEAVRLRDAVEAVPCEDHAHPRGVALAHLVDRERELDADGLLARQLREQGVLGGARAAALVEDQPETGPLRAESVGQPQHVARGRREVGGAKLPEAAGQRSG